MEIKSKNKVVKNALVLLFLRCSSVVEELGRKEPRDFGPYS